MLQTIIEACFTSSSHARNDAWHQTMPADMFATPKSQIKEPHRAVNLERGAEVYAQVCAACHGADAEYLLRRKPLDRNDLEGSVFVADLSRLLVLGRSKPSLNLLQAIPLIDNHEAISWLCPVDTHGKTVRDMTTAVFSRGSAR